jgi:hypothetical protein
LQEAHQTHLIGVTLAQGRKGIKVLYDLRAGEPRDYAAKVTVTPFFLK